MRNDRAAARASTRKHVRAPRARRTVPSIVHCSLVMSEGASAEEEWPQSGACFGGVNLGFEPVKIEPNSNLVRKTAPYYKVKINT